MAYIAGWRRTRGLDEPLAVCRGWGAASLRTPACDRGPNSIAARRMPDHFSKLSAFVAVAEHRHFARAAAQLGISPSTLTQTIRSLEAHLGVRLLNRTTRAVSLTAAGEQLLQHMQPVVAAIHDALDAMNSFRDSPRGVLRLSCNRASAAATIAPLLPAFLDENPDITLE